MLSASSCQRRNLGRSRKVVNLIVHLGASDWMRLTKVKLRQCVLCSFALSVDKKVVMNA